MRLDDDRPTTSVQAFHHGAQDYLSKQQLSLTVLEQVRQQRTVEAQHHQLRERAAALLIVEQHARRR